MNFHTFYQTVERAELAYLQSKLKYGQLRQRVRDRYDRIYENITSNNVDDSQQDYSEEEHLALKSESIATDSDNYLLEQIGSDDNEEIDIETEEESMAISSPTKKREKTEESPDTKKKSSRIRNKTNKMSTPTKTQNRSSISTEKDTDDEKDKHEEDTSILQRDKTKEDELIRHYFDIKCKICSKKFDFVMAFHNHCKEVHHMKPHLLYCKCGLRYVRAYEMRDHVFYHLNPDAFM